MTDEARPQGDGPGLDPDEVAARRRADGPNVLPQRGATPAWRVALDQVADPLVILLLASCVVAGVVGEWIDAIAIAVIVGVNATVGFAQEYRAERAVIALRTLTARRARVQRQGRPQIVEAAEIVVGDILLLEAGDVVAADARVLAASRLAVDEATLTGESMPVDKGTDPVPPDAALAERRDCVFLGTAVTRGTGRARVEAIGAATEMGRIAALLEGEGSGATPLQRRLAHLGRILVVACVGMVALVAGVGWLRGMGGIELLMTSVSLAVAAVPEGLPAVVTVALAVGVRRMTRHGVLVRRLAAVETLGSATVICTDKTGTLTTGVMSAREVFGDRKAVLAAAAACCDAVLAGDADAGDPTELAILRAAAELDIDREAIDREAPRVDTEPFDPATRRMVVTRADGHRYTKGALEAVQVGRAEAPAVNEAAARMASEGQRVLAVALDDEILGLVGLADAPRPEAIAAIAKARAAGVRVVMITGDDPRTAAAIARAVGLAHDDAEVEQRVHARATAADKTRIVKDLRAAGEVVAMTGDGVNDAPSIREADIGVAMGRTATEVTREASEMILTEDDLGGLVDAIREGRIIYGNVRKTIVYLLGGNASELVLMLVAVSFGLPLPLLPLHLLWTNLVGEPLPGLALAIDPPSHDVLTQTPRSTSEPLVRRHEWIAIGAVAALQAAIVLGVYVWALGRGDVDYARTMAFCSLVFGVVMRALASRDTRTLVLEGRPLGNVLLLLVVAAAMVATAVLTTIPATRSVFHLTALGWLDLGVAFVAGLVPITGVELGKLVMRRRRPDVTPTVGPA